ncbi:unnamed protein product [Didymodactylos carnosus]|uniref:Integrase catalytic domain-containing protein n=2 Tax=Didymodactylos carnosus TaxID=1234261 RepID=A0A815ARP3_9BILA|nr:unnamed protein product [Didymodactylos carnosus]CAF4040062.1 unnamed protein product [Didymodactylos carnosus]
MAKALAEATSENVVKFIYDEILITFGCPISVISDRGKAFVSNTLKKYLELQQRHHLHTSNVLMVCLYPCLQNTLKVGHKWGCLYSTSIICMSKPTIPGDTHQPYVYDENNNNDLNEYRAIQLEELGDRHSAAQIMTYQRVQYKGRTKNISISVIDNQEFVLLQDVHDIFPKITVLLSADDNPIQYEMDDKGNRLLPLRIKAYSNDTLIGYSPDDSDTSDNSQKATGTKTMTMVTKTKEILLPLMTKLFDFLFIIGLQSKSKLFSSSAAASLKEKSPPDEIVEKQISIRKEDIDELK